MCAMQPARNGAPVTLSAHHWTARNCASTGGRLGLADWVAHQACLVVRRLTQNLPALRVIWLKPEGLRRHTPRTSGSREMGTTALTVAPWRTPSRLTVSTVTPDAMRRKADRAAVLVANSD